MGPLTVGTRPIFLSGRIITDNGLPLPGSIDIQSVCAGLRRTMARANAEGVFSFQWSTTANSYGDASQMVRATGGTRAGSLTGSQNGNRGLDPIASCELLAEYPGYASSRVSLYDRAGQDTWDVGVIVMHMIAAGEGHTVSLLSLKAPKDAKKYFEKATNLSASNKPAEAMDAFASAVASYPEFADAWLSMGRIQWDMGDHEAARGSFRRAMTLDNKLVGPWQELGFLACDDARWEDAVQYLDQAVRLDPVNANGLYYDALANYNLQRYDHAERSVRAALKLDGAKNPRGQFLLGLVLIGRKDPVSAIEALRNYIATAPEKVDLTLARKQLARLETTLHR